VRLDGKTAVEPPAVELERTYILFRFPRAALGHLLCQAERAFVADRQASKLIIRVDEGENSPHELPAAVRGNGFVIGRRRFNHGGQSPQSAGCNLSTAARLTSSFSGWGPAARPGGTSPKPALTRRSTAGKTADAAASP